MNCIPSIESPNVAAAWTALRSVRSIRIGAPYRPDEALSLALALASQRRETPARRRHRRLPVPPGALVEHLPAPSGSPRLEPAPGAVPGIDAGRSGISVYRALQNGVVGDRRIRGGARILVSKRAGQEGDLALVSVRGALRLAALDEKGAPISLAEARVLGVVEGIVAEAPERP